MSGACSFLPSEDQPMTAVLEPQTARVMIVPSPLGNLRLTSDGEAITGLYLPNHCEGSGCMREATPPDKGGNRTAIAGTSREFREPVSLSPCNDFNLSGEAV